MTNVVQIERKSSPTAETAVIERLQRWREVLGAPIGNGRDNPDNDLWYLLLDAEDAITGLRRYARSIEASLAARADVR